MKFCKIHYYLIVPKEHTPCQKKLSFFSNQISLKIERFSSLGKESNFLKILTLPFLNLYIYQFDIFNVHKTMLLISFTHTLTSDQLKLNL